MTLQGCSFLSPQLVLGDPCHLSCSLQFRFKQAELFTELTEQTDTDKIRRLCIVDTFRIVRSATTKISALTSTPQKALHLGLIHCITLGVYIHRVCDRPLTYLHSQFTIHFVYFTTLCLFVLSIALCLLFGLCTRDHIGYFLPRSKIVNSAKSP